ncbi:hypothetical protein AB4369_28555, partial [Vibrio sp. 10N.261.49.A5]
TLKNTVSLPIYFQAKEYLEQVFRYVKAAQEALRVADLETARQTIESLNAINYRLTPSLYSHSHSLPPKSTRSAIDTVTKKTDSK